MCSSPLSEQSPEEAERLREVREFLARDFPQFNNQIEALSPRYARLRRVIQTGDLRPGGTVSGPLLMTVADAALYVAILGTVGIIPLAVTTQLSVNFLRRPRADADIVAECQLLKVGQKLVVGEVSLYSAAPQEDSPQAWGEPVAHAVGTYALPPS